MSEIRNLKWGEKHLCGDLFTIKITLGYELWNLTQIKFTALGLTVVQVLSSKKTVKPRYLAYGVLNQSNFQKYLNIKNEALAKLLINKAAVLIESVNTRKEVIKLDEKIESGSIIEPITLD